MLRCSVLVAKVAAGVPVGFASGFASVDSFGVACEAVPVSGGGCGGGRPPLRALFLRAPSSCGRLLSLASCPVAQMNQSNTPYLLRPFFYELGHFHGDGLLPVVSGLWRVIVLRQQKRATNSEAYGAAFP